MTGTTSGAHEFGDRLVVVRPSAKTCTRCKEPIPEVLEGWQYTSRIARMRAVTTEWQRLRFCRFRWRWMPKYADERLSSSYFSDLDLCNECAGAVFLFAQGKAAPEIGAGDGPR